MLAIVEVKPWLSRRGPMSGAQLAKEMRLPVRGLERMLAREHGVERIAIARTPLSEGPMVDEEFARYPRIDMHTGEVRLSPNPLRASLYYTVYFASGQEKEAEMWAGARKDALHTERGKALTVAHGISKEVAERNGGREGFGVLLGGDFSRTLGVVNRRQLLPMDEENPSTISIEPSLFPESKLQAQSDVDLWTYTPDGHNGLYGICSRVKEEIAGWEAPDGRQVRYDLIPVNARQVEYHLESAINGRWTGFSHWMKDLLHAVPLPGDGIAQELREQLDARADLRGWWAKLVEKGREADAEFAQKQ